MFENSSISYQKWMFFASSVWRLRQTDCFQDYCSGTYGRQNFWNKSSLPKIETDVFRPYILLWFSKITLNIIWLHKRTLHYKSLKLPWDIIIKSESECLGRSPTFQIKIAGEPLFKNFKSGIPKVCRYLARIRYECIITDVNFPRQLTESTNIEWICISQMHKKI